MRTVFISLFILLFSNTFGQIVMSGQPEKKAPKKDTTILFYVEGQYGISFRSLFPNPDFLNTPLGQRASEESIKLYSYQLGITLPLTPALQINTGLGMFQNGEQYSWQSSENDSSFHYESRYRYFGMPVQLQLQHGKSLKFQIAGGLLPQLIQSYTQDQSWTNALGSKGTYTDKQRTGKETFILSAIANAGFHYQFKSQLGLRLGVSYRRQLTNTYIKYADYIHKSRNWGGYLGLTFRF